MMKGEIDLLMKNLKQVLWDVRDRINRIMINAGTLITEFRSSPVVVSDERAMLVLAHALEKGMAMPSIKQNFGEDKAVSLIERASSFCRKGGNINNYALYEADAVLRKYISFKKEQKQEIEEIEKIYLNFLENSKFDNSSNYCNAGAMQFQAKRRECPLSFNEVVQGRKSIRKYRDGFIKDKSLIRAIENANYAPSACNRQPCKVIHITNSTLVSELNKLVPGNNGFTDYIHEYLIIVSKRDFFAEMEFLQWYVNGGIYLGFLALALENEGINSCIYQWPINLKGSANFTNKLCLSKYDSIVAVMSIGYAADDAKIICSQRKKPEDTLVTFE